MSNSVRPHRWQPTRLPHPWDSPGKNTGVGCHFLLQCRKVKSESEVIQSCQTLSDPMDCSLSGSSIHGFSSKYCQILLFYNYLFICFWLCRVLVAAHEVFLGAHGLLSTCSERAPDHWGSVLVVHELCCPLAYGILVPLN